MYDIDEFMEHCLETTDPIAHLNHEDLIGYLVAGLASEAGEVAGKYKKYLREGKDHYLKDMHREIGDVLWYCAVLCYEMKGNLFALSDCATAVINKLADRHSRGALTGEGDNR